jgi:hypothetical protein
VIKELDRGGEGRGEIKVESVGRIIAIANICSLKSIALSLWYKV